MSLTLSREHRWRTLAVQAEENNATPLLTVVDAVINKCLSCYFFYFDFFYFNVFYFAIYWAYQICYICRVILLCHLAV